MPGRTTRGQVLAFRVRAQQLDRATGDVGETRVLDLGVQDTGPDGGLWALANRGVDVSALSGRELVTLWTVRGAPHVYRREDVPGVAAAVAPYSAADAAKRIHDAAKPLRAAGTDALSALAAVAAAMRTVVTGPMVKGEVSSRVAAVMDEPYLRQCRPCRSIHLYEMPFRLAALRAGLELRAGTSPPVLEPIPGFAPADEVPDRLDLVRGYLRLLGPATPQQVADFLDAPVREVRSRWPDDAVEVDVEGERRWLLGADVDVLAESGSASGPARLLGPYDLFLQARDRSLLVEDAVRAATLWPVLGRPGAVLLDGDLAGTWRARKSGSALTVEVTPWRPVPPAASAALEEQAERLAAHRHLRLASLRTTA